MLYWGCSTIWESRGSRLIPSTAGVLLVIFIAIMRRVCACRRSGRCRSATSGESSTIYWTRVGRRTAVATPSRDILTVYCAVLAASPLDRRSEASRALLQVPLPRPASLTCLVHITHIIGTAASAAVEILRRAATRRQPTRCS